MTDQTENPRHALKRLLVSEFDVPNPSMIRDTIVDRFVLIDRATLPEDPGYSIDNYTNADGFWDSARRNIATALAIEASLREQAEKEAALDRALDDEAFELAKASDQWGERARDEFFAHGEAARRWRKVAEKARALHAPVEGDTDDVDEGLGAYIKPADFVPAELAKANARQARRNTASLYFFGERFDDLTEKAGELIDRVIDLEDRANEAENAPTSIPWFGRLNELLRAFETSAVGSEGYRDGTRAVCRDVRALFHQVSDEQKTGRPIGLDPRVALGSRVVIRAEDGGLFRPASFYDQEFAILTVEKITADQVDMHYFDGSLATIFAGKADSIEPYDPEKTPNYPTVEA